MGKAHVRIAIMSEIRNRGLEYLSKRVNDAELVAVSKKYSTEESWTGEAAWWFDIPKENVENNPEGIYYLLCEKDNRDFHILQVPNRFFIEHMDGFEVRYNNRIRLHLDANESSIFIDQRGHGKVAFTSYLLKE